MPKRKHGAKCTSKNPLQSKEVSHPKVPSKTEASNAPTENSNAVLARLSKLYSLPFPHDFVDLFNYCKVILHMQSIVEGRTQNAWLLPRRLCFPIKSTRPHVSFIDGLCYCMRSTVIPSFNDCEVKWGFFIMHRATADHIACKSEMCAEVYLWCYVVRAIWRFAGPF